MSGAVTSDNVDYLLGSEPTEMERLGLQHRVWAADTYRLWQRAGFATGHQLLDLGSGPGLASVELASLVGPTGQVIAIDSSPRFLSRVEDEALRQGLDNVSPLQLRFGEGDLPTGPFDGAFARWLFCFLPEPQQLVAEVSRVLKPGGRFAVVDYSNYLATRLWPVSAAFETVLSAVCASWSASGGDLDVGSQLPALCEQHGLQVTSLRSWGRIARPGQPLWEWPRRFFAGYLPGLVEQGFLDEGTRVQFERDLSAATVTPGAFLHTPPMVALVAEKS